MAAVPRAPVKYSGKDAELASLLKNPPKQVCPVGKLLVEHPNHEEIQDALENPKWSAAALAATLSQKVAVISGNILSQHRNQTCACYRNG